MPKDLSQMPQTQPRTSPEVRLSAAMKRYPGAERATFKDLDLACPAGKITVIVGPSGCGKTTLLRAICGLEGIDGGTLHFGPRDVTRVAAEQRGVAMVFQNYALYPDKTVAGNIGFPLRMARLPKAEVAERTAAAARLVRIEDYLERRPAELSGGQRQRVGIARAIVRGPDVLLMDEPLSNLDAKLRTEMRSELKALQRQIGATTIYVTHDQTEALTLADHLVVMQGGVIEHQGAPAQVFARPANAFVADFVGRMNLFPGMAQGSRFTLDAGSVATLGQPLGDGRYLLGARPEEIGAGPAQDAALSIEARVQDSELLGTEQLVTAATDGHIFKARLPVAQPLSEVMTFHVAPGHLHVFDETGQRRETLS
ncbi:ABC transporter ATP-binding protein [Pseudooceanicola sp. 200-1SW]|uniref:ABC transporter ATP-binding protein n=1 Tax=Pseudooceanicola sp. 200-1SW TaxID=3425949 RepID=UPI003D7FB717